MTDTIYSQEQIIEKVRGLLALAKSSNPNEAALAAQRATALMQKYNLDQAQVDLSRNQPAYTKSAFALESNRRWRHRLMSLICNANFCQFVWYVGKRDGFILGRAVNIPAVRVLYDYLADSLDKMAEEAFKHYTWQPMNDVPTVYTMAELKRADDECQRRMQPGNKISWKDSFFNGACDVLALRLLEQKQAFEAESVTSRALVVMTDNELKDYASKVFGDTLNEVNSHNDHTTKEKRGQDGWHEGFKAGHKISLVQQLPE